jgi:hypothetical protein
MKVKLCFVQYEEIGWVERIETPNRTIEIDLFNKESYEGKSVETVIQEAQKKTFDTQLELLQERDDVKDIQVIGDTVITYKEKNYDWDNPIYINKVIEVNSPDELLDILKESPERKLRYNINENTLEIN